MAPPTKRRKRSIADKVKHERDTTQPAPNVVDGWGHKATEEPAPTAADVVEESTARQTELPLPATEGPKKEPGEKIGLKMSEHEARLNKRALAKQAKYLAKLAETAKEEGYARAAQEFKGDAGAITQVLLAQLSEQTVMLAPTQAEARGGIAEALRPFLAPKFEHEYQAGREAASVDKGKAIGHRSRNNLETVLGALAVRISLYVEHVGNTCYAYGVAAREQSTEGAMLKGLDALRGEEITP